MSLGARGHTTSAPTFGATAPATPDAALLELRSAIPADQREVVLVAHSNAGFYLPALATANEVSAAIFVDAALPPVDASRVRLAPARVQESLAALADDGGLLPVWTGWWDAEVVESLFPSPELREAVERQQRRFLLSYFTQEIEVPPGWTSLPCAYLTFSDAYRAEADTARARGWPVSHIEGGHLEMLAQPGRVARELEHLLHRATTAPS